MLTNQQFDGKRLKRLREHAGWSLRDLGAKIKRQHSTIGKIENGTTQPSAKTIGRLCKVFNVHSSFFYQEVNV